MKIIHIESGLGNQMLSYCEYLAMKKANPNDEVYIENVIFDIPECNEVICQWNGYELDKVFGINVPNVKDIMSSEQWNSFMRDIRVSHFWKRNWNYPVHITNALNRLGMNITNFRGDFESPEYIRTCRTDEGKLVKMLKNTYPYLCLRAWTRRKPVPVTDYRNELFRQSGDNLFTGQKLLFKYKGSGIELIEDEIRKTFVFPELTDDKNRQTLTEIRSCNAVSIHARRGDMLGVNGYCYASGYFKRAVKYIRERTENPVFYIFCDTGSVQWCRENGRILGLDFKKDTVRFVDWNKSTESYRDMQLMSACKHQVITNSTFGWWGTFFNTNPDKITCSPEYRINTTITL